MANKAIASGQRGFSIWFQIIFCILSNLCIPSAFCTQVKELLLCNPCTQPEGGRGGGRGTQTLVLYTCMTRETHKKSCVLRLTVTAVNQFSSGNQVICPAWLTCGYAKLNSCMFVSSLGRFLVWRCWDLKVLTVRRRLKSWTTDLMPYIAHCK